MLRRLKAPVQADGDLDAYLPAGDLRCRAWRRNLDRTVRIPLQPLTNRSIHGPTLDLCYLPRPHGDRAAERHGRGSLVRAINAFRRRFDVLEREPGSETGSTSRFSLRPPCREKPHD